MKAPRNRKVVVVGYDAATALGSTFPQTWEAAAAGRSGLRQVTRCETSSRSNIVGEIPGWDPSLLPYVDRKESSLWNAASIFLTMEVCRRALAHAGLEIGKENSPRTGCLIGSALNGADAHRTAVLALLNGGPMKVSPYLLPNICANLPAGKAGMLLGFSGPVFSPQGACASGNHAVALGARLIRDGDCDFMLAGGAETCILPEIIQGFSNMLATIKVGPKDRACLDPGQASRPFSLDRKGFVLAEGAAVLVLAAEEAAQAHGLRPRAEIAGIGWNSDAHHFTRPNAATVIQAMQAAIEDAEITPADIGAVNAHGTSTLAGDTTEAECLRSVFGRHLAKLPVSANKSQLGHSLGAAAAIEAALAIEAMQHGLVLPTINHLPDPAFSDLDVVPNQARRHWHEFVLSNAFGFGGTNCCLVLRGMQP